MAVVVDEFGEEGGGDSNVENFGSTMKKGGLGILSRGIDPGTSRENKY